MVFYRTFYQIKFRSQFQKRLFMSDVKVPPGKMICNPVIDSFQVFGSDLKFKNGCQKTNLSQKRQQDFTPLPTSVYNLAGSHVVTKN